MPVSAHGHGLRLLASRNRYVSPGGDRLAEELRRDRRRRPGREGLVPEPLLPPPVRHRRRVGKVGRADTLNVGHAAALLLCEHAYRRSMDVDAARRFVETNHRAILSTRRGDGSPQMSPVAVALSSEGHLVVSSRETAMKTKNLRRDPSASVCVFTDGFFGDWVQIDGTAQVVSLPEAMSLLVAYYRTIAGEHDDWLQYEAAMENERRVALVIGIDRAGPDKSG